MIIMRLDSDGPSPKHTFITTDCYGELSNKIKKFFIEDALRRTNGNKVQAALIMGINRNTLSAYCKQFNIKSTRGSR